MVMRFVPIFILIGCEGKSPIESIALHWDSTPVYSGEEVNMPIIRRFAETSSVTMNIANIGFESSVDINANDESLPEWLSFDTEFPLPLRLGESVDVQVSWNPEHTDGLFSEELTISHEQSDFYFSIAGEIEPYVQLQLQELSNVTDSVAAEVETQNIVNAAVAS